MNAYCNTIPFELKTTRRYKEGLRLLLSIALACRQRMRVLAPRSS